MKEKFVLREQYFVPFKKWCSELYGELTEFESRYVNRKEDSNDKISDIQVILDFRSLHEALIDAPKWQAKIEKDTEKDKDKDKDTRDKETKKSEVVEKITKLVEVVEKGWHALENEHGNDLPSVESIKEFNGKIKGLPEEKRKKIADQIRKHLDEQSTVYATKSFTPIFKYLRNHVP